MAGGLDRAVTSANGSKPRGRAIAELSAAGLFRLLWDALADLLGTAAVAVLVRRAVQRVVPEHRELRELVVVRANQQYRYTLPAVWSDRGDGTDLALRRLVA